MPFVLCPVSFAICPDCPVHCVLTVLTAVVTVVLRRCSLVLYSVSGYTTGDGGEQEVRLLRLPKKHLLRRSGAPNR